MAVGIVVGGEWSVGCFACLGGVLVSAGGSVAFV